MPPHSNDIPRAGILTTAKKKFIRKKVQNLGRKITLHFLSLKSTKRSIFPDSKDSKPIIRK